MLWKCQILPLYKLGTVLESVFCLDWCGDSARREGESGQPARYQVPPWVLGCRWVSTVIHPPLGLLSQLDPWLGLTLQLCILSSSCVLWGGVGRWDICTKVKSWGGFCVGPLVEMFPLWNGLKCASLGSVSFVSFVRTLSIIQDVDYSFTKNYVNSLRLRSPALLSASHPHLPHKNVRGFFPLYWQHSGVTAEIKKVFSRVLAFTSSWKPSEAQSDSDLSVC